MKIIVNAFLLIIVSVSILKSQEILWQKSYRPDNQTGSWACYIKSTEDNGMVLIGKLDNKPMKYPYPFLIKIDKNGNQEWTKYIYTDNYYLLDFSFYLTQNTDHSYTLLAGLSNDPVYEEGWLWFYRYDLSPTGDSLKMVRRNKDNSKYIRGIPYYYKFDDGTILYSLHDQLNIFVGIFFVKTDNEGTVLWKKKLMDDSLILKPITRPKTDWDGNFIFLSAFIDKMVDSINATFVVIKTDAECNEISRKLIKSDYFDSGRDILPTKDSGYVILSMISGLTKLDKNMNKLWQKPLLGDTLTRLFSMVENSDGDYICAGHTVKYDKYGREDTTTSKGWVVKVDKNGNKVWDLPIGKNGVNNDFRYISLSGNSEYFVAGTVENSAVVVKIKDNTTSVAATASKNTFLILPNPATDFIDINLKNESSLTASGKVQIYNTLGIEIISVEKGLDLTTQRIDISNLSAGVYFIKIGDKVEKFVKI